MEETTKFESISWRADEYQDNPKSWVWILVFSLGAAAVVLLIAGITGDFLPTVSVALSISLYGIYVIRQPHKQDYKLTTEGIVAGSRLYSFKRFRSFSVLTDRPNQTLFLVPSRRFILPLMVEMPNKQAKMIVEQLSHFLPYSSVKPDPIERLISYLRL